MDNAEKKQIIEQEIANWTGKTGFNCRKALIGLMESVEKSLIDSPINNYEIIKKAVLKGCHDTLRGWRLKEYKTEPDKIRHRNIFKQYSSLYKTLCFGNIDQVLDYSKIKL